MGLCAFLLVCVFCYLEAGLISRPLGHVHFRLE